MWTDDLFASYIWYNSETDTLVESPNLLSLDSVAVYLTVIDSNGCSTTSDTNWVIIWPVPDATIILGSTSPFCRNDSILVSVLINDSYLWNNGADSSNTYYSYPDLGNYSIIVEVISDDGCIDQDTLKIIIEPCDVNVDNNNLQNINIFPNPFFENLSIFIDQQSAIQIYASDGKLVYNHKLQKGQNDFNLEHLSSGIYTIVIRNEEGVFTKKIIKN